MFNIIIDENKERYVEYEYDSIEMFVADIESNNKNIPSLNDEVAEINTNNEQLNLWWENTIYNNVQDLYEECKKIIIINAGAKRKDLLQIAKPILFNSKMVLAILDDRKKCTSRAIKPQPQKNMNPAGFVIACTSPENMGKFMFSTNEQINADFQYIKSPYKKGDILYVREAIWQQAGCFLDIDGETRTVFNNECKYVATDDKPDTGRGYTWIKRPSIHMPKAAARIFLKITDIQVKRIQDISEDIAVKEGVYPSSCKECISGICDMCPDEGYNEIDCFSELWNSTIKKDELSVYGWEANPYVWRIWFDRIYSEI